jgi:negative regulator of flagellin synthesis FlgM
VTTIHNGLEANLGIGSGATDKAQAAQGQAASTQQSLPQSGSATQAGEVQITPAAQLMADLEQQISSTPDMDQSRVDSISRALSNGSYQVSSSSIADGLLAAQKFDPQASAGASPGTQPNTVSAFTATSLLGAGDAD